MKSLTNTETSPEPILAKRLEKMINASLDAKPELQSELAFLIAAPILESNELLETLADHIADDIASQSEDPKFRVEIGDPKQVDGQEHPMVEIKVTLA